MTLSRRITERDKKLSRIMGDKLSSYFYNLGFVIGVIDQELTYTR